MNARRCRFCDTVYGASRAREHVLPGWLLDELGVRQETITPTHFAQDGSAASTRTHRLDELLEGRVCATCNSGWMSEMENQAKPALRALMTLERRVVDLGAEERIVLARWTAKTAFALNSASNYPKNIPAAHFTALRTAAPPLPDRTAVYAQQHDGEATLYWLQGANWRTAVESESHEAEECKAAAKLSYKISFQFRRLLLTVAWWPDPAWHFLLWRGVHVPLWPHKGRVGWYEHDDFPWADSLSALAHFHHGLMVAKDRSGQAPHEGA